MAKWIIDPDHSVTAFSVLHLTIARVHGQFNGLAGTVHLDPEDHSGLSVAVVIDTAGISTGIGMRDEHLRSPDFFDVARFPTMTFRSTGFQSGGGGKGILTGQLTIRDTTLPVMLDASIMGPVQCPEEIGGETTIGISARTTINREDFGMTWNLPLPGGGVAVGRDIEIVLEIEADLEE